MEKSSFQFKEFIVLECFMKNTDVKDESEVEVFFTPHGKLSYSEGKYELILDLKLESETKSFTMELKSKGLFSFQNIEREKLDNLLYINSPALIYPYIRAFVSTTTSVAGIPPLLMPTMNLSKLKTEIKNNLTEH